MINRRHALGLLAAGAVLPRAVHARARLSYDLAAQDVAKGVWMIEGATEYFTDENGGAIVNCVLLRGDTGMIIVDTGSSLKYGEALRAVASMLDPRGVSAVVNTHHHPDHFFGNQAFSGGPIYALAGTRALAETEGDALSDNMYRLLGDWMRGTEVIPPNAAIAGGETVIDGRRFTALPLSGHTGADLALLDQETGLLIAGDLAFYNRAPTTPHADLAKWRDALKALELVEPAAIAPGHGPLDRTGESLRYTRAYLDWLETTLSRAATEGLSMMETMALPLPEAYATDGAQPQEYQRSVSHLFPVIERQVLPRAN